MRMYGIHIEIYVITLNYFLLRISIENLKNDDFKISRVFKHRINHILQKSILIKNSTKNNLGINLQPLSITRIDLKRISMASFKIIIFKI